MAETLLKVEGLRTVLEGAGEPVRAVDGIEIDIRRGETFAIVGESGCGKSMTALSLLRLLPETGRIADGTVELSGVDLLGLPEAGRIESGSVRLEGKDLLALPESAMRDIRGRRIAMIFQEPATSLNPVLTIGHQIGEVLELLKKLQAERGMSMLLITHDLGIVSGMAHRVAVMYAGKIVEAAERSTFFSAPQHPYTKKLFASLPEALPPAVSRQVSAPPAPLLSVGDLKVHFPIRKGLFKRTVAHVRAVDGVSLEVAAGRTLALVGESGCGKTTVGKALLQLLRGQGAEIAGQVMFEGTDLMKLQGEALRARRRELQIVFQDPYSSLNPRMRVSDIVMEGMNTLGIGNTPATRSKRVDELLGQVGLSPEARGRYPHEFSGGQRQRIAIARALAVEPRLIVCDEPTSALDVSVQAQILDLLAKLQKELGLSYLFITHNLAVVDYLAHDVAVMYLGRIVETGTTKEVIGSPKHPYTQALLSAVPRIQPGAEPKLARPVIRLEGELPSPVNPPSGCHFHPRCPKAMPECSEKYPGVSTLSPTQKVRCWLYPSDEGAKE